MSPPAASAGRLHVGLVVPGFSADDADWCIPALATLARALSRRVDARVYAIRYPAGPRAYVAQGCEVVALGGGVASGLARVRLLARVRARLVRDARERPFDLLHGFWADEPGALAVAAARQLGIPAVVSVMGGELVALDDIGYGTARGPLGRWLVRYALGRGDVVTAGSTALCHAVSRAYGGRAVECEPLGVDVGRFCPAPAAPTRVLGGSPAILHVGSLSPVKNQGVLIDAFHLVQHDLPEARLHLAGGGPLHGALVARANALGLASRVVFHGAVPHDDMPAFYRGADLCVLASRHESQSVALLEAAACGVPTAGPPVGMLPDLGAPVELAEDASPGALAAALVRLWRDPERRSRGQAGARLVAERYTATATADRLVSLYASAIAAEPGGPRGAHRPQGSRDADGR